MGVRVETSTNVTIRCDGPGYSGVQCVRVLSFPATSEEIAFLAAIKGHFWVLVGEPVTEAFCYECRKGMNFKSSIVRAA